MDPRILPWIAFALVLLGVMLIILTDPRKPRIEDRAPLVITHGSCDPSGVGVITNGGC